MPSLANIFPIEICLHIFGYLLDDPSVFHPNPFYPGCNPHTAMRDWNYYSRLLELARQRRSLELVSKYWKRVVDLNRGRSRSFEFETDIDVNRLCPFTRLSFCSNLTQCHCDGHCYCAEVLFIEDPPLHYSPDILLKLVSIPSTRTPIISLPASAWLDLQTRAMSTTKFASMNTIQSLEILDPLLTAENISILCPRLTFLGIQIWGPNMILNLVDHSISPIFQPSSSLYLDFKLSLSSKNGSYLP